MRCKCLSSHALREKKKKRKHIDLQMAGVFHEETSAGFIGRRRTSLAAQTLSLSIRCSLSWRVNNNNAVDAVRSYIYQDVL